jgi:hypothetical protein
MPTSTSHNFKYFEPERHDGLSDGVREQEQASDERKANGQLAQGASAVPSLGGRALKGRTYLSHKIVTPSSMGPNDSKRARTLRNALSREIAAGVGGGVCGVASSLFLKFAAQKTAAAEVAFQAGDFETHRKLTESARMDVLYAREDAAKAAQARPQGPADPMARIRARLADGKP